MSDRICKDCVHYWDAFGMTEYCHHPSRWEKNLVNGGYFHNAKPCWIARRDEYDCKPIGLLFERKHETEVVPRKKWFGIL